MGRRANTTGIAAALLTAAFACATASAADEHLARQLAGRDPGARIGANSIVELGDNARTFGVGRRSNFIIGLGDHETLQGGSGDDEIGAFGTGSTVRGGPGNDDVYGGAGATLIADSGHDLLSDGADDVTVILRSSRNEVIAAGRGVRITCTRTSRHNVIHARADASIGSACRGNGTRIVRAPAQRRSTSAVAQAADATTGRGTNADPFIAPCWKAVGRGCYVRFPARSLTSLWANEYVPSYRCPADHPLLAAKAHFVPFGTTVPSGVDVEGLGAIGVAILRTIAVKVDLPHLKATGLAGQTATGHPDSSATHWGFGTHSYRVILFCGGVGSFGYPAGPVRHGI